MNEQAYRLAMAHAARVQAEFNAMMEAIRQENLSYLMQGNGTLSER